MNELFLKVSLIMVKIKKGEIKEIDTSYKENIVDNYLSTIIRLVKEDVITEYFNFTVDYEFGSIINNKNNKDYYDKVYVLKHLSSLIRNKEYDKFLSFSRYFVDNIYYNKIKGLLKNNKDV